MGFIKFMGSQAGRAVRIGMGGALIGVGLGAVHGTLGYVLAGVGVVPLAAGVFDFCIFAPLGGLPFQGRELRQRNSA